TTRATRVLGRARATRTWLVPMTPAPITARSTSENLQDAPHDSIDSSLVEPGVHGQRDHLACGPLRLDRGLRLHPRVVAVAVVVVDGTRVVHGGPDTAIGQPGAQRVPADGGVVGDA